MQVCGYCPSHNCCNTKWVWNGLRVTVIFASSLDDVTQPLSPGSALTDLGCILPVPDLQDHRSFESSQLPLQERKKLFRAISLESLIRKLSTQFMPTKS